MWLLRTSEGAGVEDKLSSEAGDRRRAPPAGAPCTLHERASAREHCARTCIVEVYRRGVS